MNVPPTPTSGAKFPDVHVNLIGEDGNAGAIMGRVTRALHQAGHRDVVDDYRREAMSGDYNNLITVTTQWVTCDEGDDDE
ncbi:MAG: hypothetical protein GY926_05615 [bacterium]|nr:hypothetical protein [bacterium]